MISLQIVAPLLIQLLAEFADMLMKNMDSRTMTSGILAIDNNDDRDKPADDHSEEQTNKDANGTHVHGERPFHDGEDVNDGARIHCPGHESNLIQVRKG